MANIAIINNNGSVLSNVSGNEINLTSPQTVKLQINPKDVADMGRAGNDLQLTMSNGEKVTLKNFFTADAEGNVSKLVLQDAQGALWWVQNPEVGMSTIQPIGDISALGDAEGEHAGGGAIFPWLLGAAGVAGVAALVASGGGSSTSSDGNNSGNDTTAPAPVTNLLVTDDKAPIIGNITNNGVTNDTTPTLSGNAEAGSLVTIFDGSARLGSVVVGSDGKWSFTPSTPLGEGKHSLTTTVTDASGNTSARSPTFTLTVDTVAPDVSNISATDNTAPQTGPLTSGSSTNDTTPTFSGTAQAGSVITLYDGNTVLGSVTVGSDGKWSFTPSTALSEGNHSLSTTVTDAAGNVSDRSSFFAFKVDTSAPASSALTATDNTAPQTGAIANGASTNDTTPTLSGSAEAGAKVIIYDGSTVLGSVIAGSDGKWSFTPSSPLGQGSHSLTSTVTDAAGNVSAHSPALTITVDTSAPAAPTLQTISDNVGTETGNLSRGATTDDTTPTLSGTAEAGSKVIIYDGSTVLGSVIAGSDGKWSFTPSALGNGSHSFTVTATDAAGNVSATSPAFTITIAFDPNAISNVANFTVTDDVAPVTGALINGASTNDTTPTFSGSAVAGTTVIIRDGDTVLGKVTVGSNGQWSFTPPALPQGAHSFTTEVTNAAGQSSGRSPVFTLTVDTTAPTNTEAPGATDDQAPVTGTINDGDSTNDKTPTFNGSGEAGDIVTIYDGSTVLGSTTVGSNGTWTFTPGTALGDGSHTISTTLTDKAGNVSPPSPGLSFTVDTVAPNAPTSAPTATDNVEPNTGIINNGDSTNDTTPTLNGTGTNGDIIIIYDGDTVIGSTTVEGGTWTFTPGTALGEGSHTITTTVTDKAGNESGHSPGLTITVDTVAPTNDVAPTATDDAEPVTGAIADGGSTNDTTPTLGGSGEIGDIVIIYDGEDVIGSTTVGNDGTWTFTPTTPLGEGEHSLSTTLTDKAGNTSEKSPSLTFTVDTVAPDAPTSAPTATDDVDPITGTITDGDSTNDSTPTFSGTGTTGDLITIYDGDTAIGSVTVGGDGTWTFTPTDTLGEGSHSISTTVTDAAGNESTNSPSLSFTVDTVAPDAPASAPTATDDVDPVTGLITDGESTNDNTPTFSGTGTTGDLITIYDGDTAIGSVTVGGDGTWTFTPTDTLGEGNHSISTTVTDAAGNESANSPSLSFTVDTVAPDAPTTAPTATDDVGPVTGLITDGESTNDNTPTFSGTGTTGDLITIYDGDTAIGSVTVGGDGTWTFTPTDVLGEGSHSISTTVTDAAGNVSGNSPSLNFTVDTVAPDAPLLAPIATDDAGLIVGPILEGATTDDNTPTFSGVLAGNIGDVITIYNGDEVIGSTTVGVGGAWSFTPDALDDGDYSVTTTVTDAAGNESNRSPALDFTIDTVAPDAPLLAPIATDDAGLIVGPILEGATTDDNTPTFSGVLAGNIGDIITIYNGDEVIGSATVGAGGIWSFTPDALDDGNYSFTTTLTDAAGNESGRSPALDFTIDTVAPDAPLLAPIATDDVGLIVGPILEGATTDDNTPTFSGILAGNIGDIITIYNGDEVIGSTTVGVGGAWSFTPGALDDGDYSFTTTVKDAAGNESGRSPALDFTIDTVAPDAPLLAPIATDDAGLIVGPILEGATTDDNTPTFSGILAGNIGDIITIYNGDEVIGSTTVGLGGAWSFTPGALDDGDYSFTTTVKDAAGNESGRSPALDFTIDTVAPDAPLLAPIATDDAGLIVGPILEGATTDDNTPTFSGILAGNIGDIITIYNGDEVIGSTTVGIGGAWSFTPGALDDGDYSFTTTITDAAGNESGRSPALDFTIDTVAPDAPLLAPIATDDVGLIIGPILEGATTDDNTPTFSGILAGNIGDIITIYNGDEVIGSTTVGIGGAWSFTPGALDDGDYSFTTTITDAAGNESGRSPTLDFTIDTVSPDAPLLAPIATDDVGLVIGPILEGATTDDNTPTFSGILAGNIGDIITIYNGDEVIGSTTVGVGGAWSFTPGALDDGDYSFTTTLTDAAGNESGRSPALDFTIDTVAPDAPLLAPIATDDVGLVVGPILPGATTDDNTPTFSGILAGNIGDIITIYNGDEVIGSTTVGIGGAWSFTPGTLDDGDYSFTTTVKDAAGNESGRSPALDFTIDTVAPDAPLLAPIATDDVGLVVGPILPGATTDDNTPTFSGILAGNIGDIITIYNGDEVIGSTTVGIGGAWSFTPGALDDGNYSFTTTITDAAGNESGRSPALNFTIDATAPDAPLLAPIATDDVGLIVGPILPGATTDDNTPTFSGVLAGNIGDIITIYNGDEVIGSTTVGLGGAWIFTPGALDDGDYSFTTTITDAAGNESGRSPALNFTIDATAPDAPLLAPIATDDVGPVIGPILEGGTTDDNTPTFSGILAGNIGDIITIYNGNEVIGSTTVGLGGAWSFTPNGLNNGDYSITTTLTDAAGNESGRSPALNFTVDTDLPDAPLLAPIATDDVGLIVGPILPGATTDDSTPTFSGVLAGNIGDIITIYNGNEVIGSTTVGALGVWTFTPGALDDGDYSFTTTITDASGNESGRSPALDFTIDTVAPDAPLLAPIATDDVGLIVGPILPGTTTDDNTPTFSGVLAGNIGDIITIYNGDEVIGSTTVGIGGIWSFTPGTLDDGNYSFTTTVTDAAGNESGRSPALDFTIDTVAPDAPLLAPIATDDVGLVIGPILPGTTTDDNTPTFSGVLAGNIGDIITIYNGDEVIGSTTVGLAGAWSFTPGTLDDGDYSFTTTITDASGNESGRSPALDFTIDTVAPDAPLLAPIATDDVGLIVGPILPGATTDDNTPTFSGVLAGNIGDIITIYNGDEVIGSTTVGLAGAWSFTPGALDDGDYSFTTTITDAAGNESGRSPALNFTIDATAPDAPLLAPIATDDVGLIIGPILPGATTDDNTPTFSGVLAGNIGDIITIYNGDEVIGSTTVGLGGIWSFTPGTLDDGDYSFTTTLTDAAGNESGRSPALNFTIDATAPDAPLLAPIATDDVGLVIGPILPGATTDDNTPTFSGVLAGNIGDIITIYNGDEVIGSTTVGLAGAWSFTPGALDDGDYSFTTTITDAAGNESGRSPALNFTIDATAPDAPLLAPIATDDVGLVIGPILPGATTDDNTPTFSGVLAGNIGDIITIYNGDEVIGSTTVGLAGAWSFTPGALDDGDYSFTTTITDAAGNESGRSPALNFTIDATAPDAPLLAPIATDDVGLVIGPILPGATTDDSTPTFSGVLAGNIGDIITIYNGDEVIGSTTVGLAGAWSFTPGALDDGDYSFTTTITDAAGNESGRSPALNFTIDTVAPDAPLLAPIATDDVGLIVGPILPGATTDDNTPTFSGVLAGNIGDIITIYNGDEVIGSTTVGLAGAWSFTPGALDDGDYSFTTTITDAAGNESGRSPALNFTIDATAPDAPLLAPIATDDVGLVIGPILPGATTDDNTPTFSGVLAGNIGDIITIYNGDEVIGSTTVGLGGAWIFTPGTLDDGDYSFTTTITDAAGNESGRSPALNFTIDATAPDAPLLAPIATDDVGLVIGPILPGATTDDNTPTFSGVLAGNIGDIITIYNGDELIGSTTVGLAGAWSFTPGALDDGDYSFTTTITDAAGNESGRSPALDFTIDTVVPDAPLLAPIATDDVGLIVGPILPGATTDDNTPTFSGVLAGNIGDIITIYNGDEVIGSTTVGLAGAWSFTPDALNDGDYSFTTTITDAAGNESGRSPALDFTIDTVVPDAALLAPIATDDVGLIIGPILPGATTDDNTPTFSGVLAGNIGDIVTIYNGNEVIGSTTVGALGAWTFTPGALDDGDYSFTTTITDAAGNESGRSPALDFTIDTVVPDAPLLAPIATDDVGLVIGPILPGATTDDNTPTFSGVLAGNIGDIITIYNGDEVIGSTTVGIGGAWSFTPGALNDGDYSFTTTITDAAGNESGRSPALNFTIDATAPDAPLLAPLATDDVGLIVGPILPGTTTDDNTPTFNGVLAGNIGDIITIYDGDTAIGSTTVGALGVWSFTPTTALDNGSHTFTTTLKDDLGNESGRSPSLNFTIQAVTATDLQANNDDIQLDVTSAPATINSNSSDTGTVLVGLLGDLLNLGTGNAVAGFTVGTGHSANIDVTVTGSSLLGLINDLDVAVQRWDAATNSWVTVADTTSNPTLINIINTTSLSVSLDDLTPGQYRVAAYSNNALAGLLSTTTVSVDIADTGPAISGTTNGNVITGEGDTNIGADVVTTGTVVSQITDGNGTVYNVPTGSTGVTIQGQYGSLTILADGSYTYTVTNVSSAAQGQADSFTYTLSNGTTTSSADLNITLGTATGGNEGTTLVAHDNEVSLLETPVVTNATYSDSGFLLVGALGNILSLLGTSNAVASFAVATDHTASIDVSVTGGSILNLLSDVDLLVQRYNAATSSWVTVADTSSNPALINIISGSRVTVHLDDLDAGQYRVVGYSGNSLLGLASSTTVSVNVTDTGPAALHGSLNGNVVTDTDVLHGADSITAGTLVSQVTDSAGVAHTVGAQGVTINGLYGTLTIAQDGSYTYTLTAPSGVANGHSEDFTYTLSDGTTTSSANLHIDLGIPGSNTEVVAAFNDTTTLDIDTALSTVTHANSSHGGVTLGVQLGSALDLSLLNLSNQATLSVGANEVRSLTLQATLLGVNLGTVYDLYVYKYNETSGQYELSQRTPSWFTATLLGVSGPLDLSFTEGNYVFLLSPTTGISVATLYNLGYSNDLSHNVVTATASTTGNVITEGTGADTVPTGSTISSVDGNAVAATGNTTIVGQYGTLTINAQGAYTYTLNAGLSPTTLGTAEQFTYTVRGPQGASSSATLTVNLQQQPITAVDDVSGTINITATEPATSVAYSNVTSSTWATTASTVTQNATGNIHVDAGTVLNNISLTYTVSDNNLLNTANLTLSYYITNASGVTVAQSTTALSTNSDATPGAISLGGLALTAGDYTLHVTSISAATSPLTGRPTVTVSASVAGTETALAEFHTPNTTSTITGNIYDGSGASGERDNVGAVNTTLTVTGASSSVTLHQYDAAGTTVAGHYGTLTINPNGSYSYALNGNLNTNNITQKETFDYTLTGTNGTSSSASLTIDLHPTITGGAQADTATSTAYNDTYTLGASNDTVIFHLLDNSDATGGNGTNNVWTDFSAAQQDHINLDDLLIGWNGSSATLGQYLNVTHTGNDTIVSIDRDGSGSAFQSTQLVTLDNAPNVTLDELLQHNV